MPNLLGLSPEVIDQIIDQLEARDLSRPDGTNNTWRIDVLHLAQVCRYLYKTALPRVYRNVHFRYTRNGRFEFRGAAMLAMVQQRADLADAVRQVDMYFAEDMTEDLERSYTAWLFDKQIATFLSHLQKVKRLYVHYRAVQSIPQTLSQISKMTSLRDVRVVNSDNLCVSDLAPILGSQHIVELYAHGWKTLQNFGLWMLHESRGTGATRKMTIRGGNISDPLVAELVRWPRKLEELDVFIPSSPEDMGLRYARAALSPSKISRILQPLHSCVRELFIDKSSIIFKSHDGSRMSFAEFERLRVLSIASPLLLGGFHEDRTGQGAYALLPKSLEMLAVSVPDATSSRIIQGNFPALAADPDNVADLDANLWLNLEWLLEVARNKRTHFPSLNAVYIGQAGGWRGIGALRSLGWEPAGDLKEAFEDANIDLLVSLLVTGVLSKADQKRRAEQAVKYPSLKFFGWHAEHAREDWRKKNG